MLKAILILLLFSILMPLTYSQDTINIKGFVYSRQERTPLGYASITIKGHPLGTVANEQGYFSFFLPGRFNQDTLIVSCMGYKSYRQKFSRIPRDSVVQLYLDTLNIPIQPVVVLSKGETAEQLVRKAVRNIPRNYPSRVYCIEAFYRELCMRDDRYARLIEAAVSIQDYGYDTDITLSKIRVNEIRKSDNHLEYDLQSKAFKAFFGDQNLMVSTYYSDYVRTRGVNCRYMNFLCEENMHRYKFTLTDCYQQDGVLIYRVDLRDTLLDRYVKRPSTETLGTIYIQSGNYAIVKIESGLYATDYSTKAAEVFFKGKYLLYNTIAYRELEGKYYPYLIQRVEPVPNALKVNSSEGSPGRQYVITTLMVNNVLIRRGDFSRIRKNELECVDQDLYDKRFPYHPEFWRNYNILQLNPLMQSANADLQRTLPLEDQFKKNGK